MDTTALEAGYRTLLEVAAPGRFSPPADTSRPTAELQLAHVAATARLLSATTAEVLAGRDTRYDSTVAGNVHYLGEIGRAAGGHEQLVAVVRQCGLELVLLARGLQPEQEATAVPTRIVEGGVVRVDAPMPWIATLKTHAEVHLEERIAALRALR
jgi:hypothetical protein